MIIFIWGNSLLSGDKSSSISNSFAYQLMINLGLPIKLELFNHYIRKFAHFFEYACLGILITNALNHKILFSTKRINFLIFLFVVPIIDETIQYFVPGRNASLLDVGIDMSGFLIGSLIFIGILSIIRKKN